MMRCGVRSWIQGRIQGRRVYAGSAKSGFLELQGMQAEHSYYNLLVRGFRVGQLNLQREVPPGFGQGLQDHVQVGLGDQV